MIHLLQTLFERHFWAFDLVFLAAAALLVGSTSTQLMAAGVRPEPTASAEAANPTPQGPSASSAGRGQDRADREAIVERNVFQAKVEHPDPSDRPVPVTQPEPEPELEPFDQELVPSSLNADLVATIVGPHTGLSLAVVTHNRGRDAEMLRVGDMVIGKAELVDVRRGRIIVEHQNRLEYLDLLPEEKRPARVAARSKPAGSKSTAKGDDDDRIVKTGDNQYVVEQAVIDDTLSNLNKVARQARIVPAFRNGQSIGFKLFSIRPNSLYRKIGIQNGDIIKKINGFDISSPDRALEIYQKLKDASQVTVDVERRGRAVQMGYQIQ